MSAEGKQIGSDIDANEGGQRTSLDIVNPSM